MAGCAYYVIQRNDTTNVSIFHMSDSMQGVYYKMQGDVRTFNLNMEKDKRLGHTVYLSYEI